MSNKPLVSSKSITKWTFFFQKCFLKIWSSYVFHLNTCAHYILHTWRIIDSQSSLQRFTKHYCLYYLESCGMAKGGRNKKKNHISRLVSSVASGFFLTNPNWSGFVNSSISSSRQSRRNSMEMESKIKLEMESLTGCLPSKSWLYSVATVPQCITARISAVISE